MILHSEKPEGWEQAWYKVIINILDLHVSCHIVVISLTRECVPCVHPCASQQGTAPGWRHDEADIPDLR